MGRLAKKKKENEANIMYKPVGGGQPIFSTAAIRISVGSEHLFAIRTSVGENGASFYDVGGGRRPQELRVRVLNATLGAEAIWSSYLLFFSPLLGFIAISDGLSNLFVE